MDIIGIVAALAPDHAVHQHQSQIEGNGPDVQVLCSCGVRFTFLATEIAKLDAKPAPASDTSFEPTVRKREVPDGS
jgi:hypothetical protein